MLCTSILSEVVLGFLLWSGWLGSPTSTEKPYPCPESAQLPAEQRYAPAPPVGTACPQACIAYPAPACCPQPAPPGPVDGNGVEVCKILSLPQHLAACDLKEVFNREAVTSLPCEKPCFWKIRTAVKSAAPGGLEVDIALHADRGGVQEVYKATKILAFDTPTDVTLTGNYPEPVCLRVAARRPAAPMVLPPTVAVWNQPAQTWNQPFLFNGIPMLPMPTALPAPITPAAWSPPLPDPMPLAPYAPAGYAAPVPTLPAPTPVRRAAVRLVYESGKPRLCVKSEGTTTECLRMKLEAGAAGAVRLSAGKNHVHLAGTRWKAEADRVELGDDGRIVLAGRVKLTADKLGVCASVKAERLCVEVKGGKFEKIVDPK